jgi:hypothetical protein
MLIATGDTWFGRSEPDINTDSDADTDTDTDTDRHRRRHDVHPGAERARGMVAPEKSARDDASRHDVVEAGAA